MGGRIYITGDGADGGAGKPLNDPLFTGDPTLGACMPNIRRAVELGDFIFVVSSKLERVQQYVVGCFRVKEKISAIQAYARFPQNRLRLDQSGHLQGNIIVQADGTQHPLDRHDPNSLARRLENYIVGADPIALVTPEEIELGRAESLSTVSRVLGKPLGNRMIDVMGRSSKLSEAQAEELAQWLASVKARA
jgi:hypothetical protein